MITTRQAARAVAALSLLLLVPAAIGASGSSAAQPGTLDERVVPLDDARRGHRLQRLPAGRLLEHGQALPGDLPAARARRLDERLDAGEGTARPVDRRRRDPGDDRDHARRSLEHPGELLRRLAVQGLRPQGHERGPPGRDRVHQGSDPARRLDLPHARRRATGASSAATRWAATARSATRSRTPTCSSRRSCSARRSTSRSRRTTRARASSARSATAATSSRRTIYKSLNYPEELERFADKGLKSHMFVAVGDDEYQNPDGYEHDLDFESVQLYKTVEREPNMTSRAARAERRARLGGLGPGVRGGREVRVPVRRPARGGDHEGEADRHARRGSRGRRRGRRRRQRLRGARRDGPDRRPGERGRQGRVPDQVRPDRHEALDEGVRHGRHRPRVRARSSTRPATRSSSATRRATSTARTPATRATTSS